MTDECRPPPDEAMGIAWWNNLNQPHRSRWMDVAGNIGVVADAWAAFKKSGDTDMEQVRVIGHKP